MSRGSGVRSESPNGPRKVSCVLWTPRGTLPPRELEAELSKKGITHRASDNAHGAMALLVGRTVSEQGAQLPVRVLILVEPTQLKETQALLNAMNRYTPDAARWVYDSGANPALRALVEGDVAIVQDTPIQARPAPMEPFRAGHAPRTERRPLRLVDAPEFAPAPLMPSEPGDNDDRQFPEGSRLTDEELTMLLGDDPPASGGGDVGPTRGSGLGR